MHAARLRGERVAVLLAAGPRATELVQEDVQRLVELHVVQVLAQDGHGAFRPLRCAVHGQFWGRPGDIVTRLEVGGRGRARDGALRVARDPVDGLAHRCLGCGEDLHALALLIEVLPDLLLVRAFVLGAGIFWLGGILLGVFPGAGDAHEFL